MDDAHTFSTFVAKSAHSRSSRRPRESGTKARFTASSFVAVSSPPPPAVSPGVRRSLSILDGGLGSQWAGGFQGLSSSMAVVRAF
eukprot:3748716-Pyramimonas_sp.AAC.1